MSVPETLALTCCSRAGRCDVLAPEGEGDMETGDPLDPLPRSIIEAVNASRATLAREMGIAIREAREGLGWKQPDLATRAGVATGTVVRAERGEPTVRVSTARRLLEAFEGAGSDLRERIPAQLARMKTLLEALDPEDDNDIPEDVEAEEYERKVQPFVERIVSIMASLTSADERRRFALHLRLIRRAYDHWTVSSAAEGTLFVEAVSQGSGEELFRAWVAEWALGTGETQGFGSVLVALETWEDPSRWE